MNNNHLPEAMYLIGEREAEMEAFGDLLMETAYIESNWTFSVESELAVVGHDLEYADMDNPRGEVIRLRYFMVGTTPNGRQYRFGWERSAELAEAAFQLLAPPVEQWSLWRCIYGSQAYEQDGCEAAQLCEEMEADLGPGWMSHPEAAPAVARMIEQGVL